MEFEPTDRQRTADDWPNDAEVEAALEFWMFAAGHRAPGDLSWLDRVRHAWGDPRLTEGGALFAMVQRGSRGYDSPGCLTQIRDGRDVDGRQWIFAVIDCAAREELTLAIASDERIPRDPIDITPECLPVFAEWQKRVNAAWRGEDWRPSWWRGMEVVPWA